MRALKFCLAVGLGLSTGAMAQGNLILGSFDPLATEASAILALESIAEVDEVYRIHAMDDGRSISVFQATYGKEGARVETLRRIRSTGMVGYPVHTVDECAHAVEGRKDLTAVRALETNPYLRTLQDAESELAYAEASLAEIDALLTEIQRDLEDASEQSALRVRMYTSAREATTKARAVYQAAYERMRTTPSRENFLALLRASIDVQLAQRAEAAAASALADAEAVEAELRQEFSLAQSERKSRENKVFEKKNDADIASRALDAAWAAVSDSVLADIVALAEQVAEDADIVAGYLASQAEFIEHARAVLSGHSGGWSFWGDDNGEIPFDHLQASFDASQALALVEAARKLPPITYTPTLEEALKHPAFALVDQIEKASLQLAVNSMSLAMGMRIAGDAWHDKVIKAIARAEVACGDDGVCVDALELLGSEAEALRSLALQEAMQMESRRFQTLSNASRSRHDIAMNSIRNMKG